MVIRVYWASVTCNRKVNSDQARLKNLFESLKLDSKWIDITTSRSVMDEMREGCSNPKALPPQIFNDEIYLGTVDDMNESIEEGCVKEWLRLELTGEDNCERVTNENGHDQTPNSFAESKVDNSDSSPIVAPAVVESSAVGKRENGNVENPSPKISRKTIELQMSNPEPDRTTPHAVKMDDGRRRRILGLPSLDDDECSVPDQVKDPSVTDSNGMPVGVSKLRSMYEVKNAA